MQTWRCARWVAAGIGVIALLGCCGRATAQATAYTVTDLGQTPGATGGTFVGDINDRAQVAASSLFLNPFHFQGFLWQNGNITPLPSLGGTSTFASGINQLGDIAGTASLPGDTVDHAVLWHQTQPIDLNTLGGANSGANALNELGQVTGESEIIISGATVNHAFLWQRGAMSDLQTLGGDNSFGFAVNDRGQVTGQSDVTTVLDPNFGIPSFHGFFWHDGQLVDLGPVFGGNFNYGQDINHRVIVGAADLPGDLASHGFVWQNGVVTDLGTIPGDTSSAALATNDSGQIVGISALVTGDFFAPPVNEFACPCHAALWANGTAVDLNTLIPANSGWQLILALAINDRGQIIGQGTLNNRPRSFLLTPVQGQASTASTSSASAPVTGETLAPAAAQSNVTRVVIQHGKPRLVTQPQ